ncbi:hypothetical protein DXG01_009562 [Tephrocybe rancida]|nr:hypothetical protein DXG01_009562 [Tephrocybe rancida]
MAQFQAVGPVAIALPTRAAPEPSPQQTVWGSTKGHFLSSTKRLKTRQKPSKGRRFNLPEIKGWIGVKSNGPKILLGYEFELASAKEGEPKEYAGTLDD